MAIAARVHVLWSQLQTVFIWRHPSGLTVRRR
jgi:hypothetical protein